MDLRRLAAAALVVATAAPPGVVRASDAVVGPKGLPCRLVPRGDLSSDQRFGHLVGGPYAATGTLTCTVRTLDGSSASASATGGPVLMLAPRPVEYTTASSSSVGVCTAFTPPGGPTVYLEQLTPADVGYWTTDAMACSWMLDTRLPALDPLLPPIPPITIPPQLPCQYCQLPWVETDIVVCAYLKTLYPGAPPAVEVKPDGDVWVGGVWFWDCPPYAVT